MNNAIKKGLIITSIVLFVFLAGFILSTFYFEEEYMKNGQTVLTVFLFALLTIFISLIFSYITICLNNKTLWHGILALYILSIFWIILRIFKVIIHTDNYALLRMIWYLYYLPMIFGPFILMSLTNYIFIKNKKTFYIISIIIFILNLLLFIFVISNDASQLVFVFDKSTPESEWTSNANYARTWLYYVIYVVIILELIYCGIIIGIFTRRKRMLLAGIIYIVCAGIILTYGILYVTQIKLPIYVGDMVFVYLLIGSIIIFVSVKYGLFISSGSYDDFFDKCIFPLRIKSRDGLLIENQSYQNIDKNNSFKEHNKIIKGNTFTVYEDVSKINEYNKTLRSQLDSIVINNQILGKEKEILKVKEIDNARKLLNERIENAINYDIQELNDLVNSLDDKLDKNNKQQMMILSKISSLCIIIKRKSYLVLMEEKNKTFSRESLLVFIKELLSELAPNLLDSEVIIIGFSEIDISFVSKCVDYLYQLVKCLTSSYKLLLIFSKKDHHFILKINLIDYSGENKMFSSFIEKDVNCIVKKENNVYTFLLSGEEDV